MSTPVFGHDPIPMRRRLPDMVDGWGEDVPWVDLPNGGRVKTFPGSPLAVGDFYWDVRRGQRKLVVALPSNGESGFITTAWHITYPNVNGAQWHWDGEENAPTLTPSLHAVGMWHGWVTAGQLVEAR